MSDENKDRFARLCIVHQVNPESILDNNAKIITNLTNLCIEFVNNYFETPEGKAYLEMRKRIENIGQK